jgi:hypothetical protein
MNEIQLNITLVEARCKALEEELSAMIEGSQSPRSKQNDMKEILQNMSMEETKGMLQMFMSNNIYLQTELMRTTTSSEANKLNLLNLERKLKSKMNMNEQSMKAMQLKMDLQDIERGVYDGRSGGGGGGGKGTPNKKQRQTRQSKKNQEEKFKQKENEKIKIEENKHELMTLRLKCTELETIQMTSKLSNQMNRMNQKDMDETDNDSDDTECRNTINDCIEQWNILGVNNKKRIRALI